MKNEFDHKDLESFLRQNAGQFRMFPSEDVWKSIHKTLHPERKWYALGLVLLLLSVGTLTFFVMRNSGKVITSAKELASVTPVQNKTEVKKIEQKPLLILKHNTESNSNNLTSINIPTIASWDNEMISVPDISLPGLQSDKAKIDIAKINLTPANHPASYDDILPAYLKTNPVPAENNIANNKPADKTNSSLAQLHLLTGSENKLLNSFNRELPETRNERSPFTIESIANDYHALKSRKRWSWEVYFTPTVSYRKLSENKGFINSATAQLNNYTPPASGYLSIASIKDLVMHKPDMGVQLGFTSGYHLSKRFKIIGGLQFNVSKYDIKASFSQPVVATIALRSGNGVDALSTVTNLRNLDNAQSNWLRNLYFSAAAPIGAEFKVFNGKPDIGISGTIQPMFILNDKAYLISTDYKDYAQVPSLTSNWNISAGMEAYAGLSTGKLHWRIGPTVRYQLRSSFSARRTFARLLSLS